MPITFLDEEEDIVLPVSPTKRKITFLDEEEEEVGTLQGISNAAMNAFDSSRQAMAVVGGVTPEEAQDISKIEYNKSARKLAPGYAEYQEAEGWDAVGAFLKNPIEVTSNIIAEGLAGSLPALGAGLASGGVGAAAGSVLPGVGTGIGFTAGQVAGTFAGSLATEYGGKILEELQEAGMDINDPQSIQTFFGNETLLGEAREKALKRGVPVAAFDALSAGIGGKLGRVFGTKVLTEGEKIIGKQFATKTGEALTELGVQAGLGGGGEVAGSLVAGEPIEGKAVFGEGIGEAGPGSVEVITGRIADRNARLKVQEGEKIKQAADLATNLEENNAPLTAQVVQAKAASNIEQDKLAAELENLLDEEELTSELQTTFTPLTPEEPVTPVTQPTPTDATQEIIQPEGVRQEPQDGTQVETEEAIARYRVFNPEGSKEKGEIESGVKLKDAWYDREVNNLSSLSGLSNQSVNSVMLPSIQDSEVLKSVVTFIPVDVMNDLRVRNIPADELLNNPNMLRDTLASDGKNDIFRGVVSALGSGITGLRAELLGRLGRNDLEGAAALIAGFKNPSSLASFLAQDDIPKFTSSTPAEFTNALSRAASRGLLPVGSDAETISTNFARLFDLSKHSAKLKPEFKKKSISNRIQPPAPAAEVAAPEPIISEIPTTSELVGAEPAAVVEQEQVATAEAPAITPAPEVVAPAAPTTAAPTAQEGAKGMNLQEVSESAIAAFPDMMEAEGGLLPLTRFTPDEQASLRNAGIVETATTSTGETYEGVNAEYLWQRRKQLQDERAKKVQESTTPAITPAPVAETPAAPAPEVAPKLERTSAGKEIIKQAKEGGVNLAELDLIESAIQQIDNPESSFIPESTTAEAVQYLQYTPEGTSVVSHLQKLSKSTDKRDAGIKRRTTEILEKITPTPAVSETITPAEPKGTRVMAAAYIAPDGTQYTGPSHLAAMQMAKYAGKITRAEIDTKQTPKSRETSEFGFKTNSEQFVTRDQAESIARQSGQLRVNKPYSGKLHSNEVALDEFTKEVSPVAETPAVAPAPEVAPAQESGINEVLRKAENAATRDEAAQIGSDFAELDPSIPPPTSVEYEIVKAISNKASRRGYNADVLTEENIKSAKESGLLTKTKIPKLTEAGRNLVTDGDRAAKERENIIGDITDKIIDQTVSAWDAKNNPASASFKERIAAQPSPVAETPAPVEAPSTPSSISVGSRVKGNGPQTYIVEEVLTPSQREAELGEQYYRIRNERTGKVGTFESKDIKPVKAKGARKVFAGEKAEMPQFMRDSLDTARAMAASGKTTEEIRAVTGWFPGKFDGKMRWEIPDAGVTTNPLVGVIGTNNIQALREGRTAGTTLGELLEHPALFEAYPDLKDVSVVFDPKLNSNGAHNAYANTISIKQEDAFLSKERESTLLHEIQHVIQGIESFPRGGNELSIFDVDEQELINLANKFSPKVEEYLSKRSSVEESMRNSLNILRSLTPSQRTEADRLAEKFSKDYDDETEQELETQFGELGRNIIIFESVDEVESTAKNILKKTSDIREAFLTFKDSPSRKAALDLDNALVRDFGAPKLYNSIYLNIVGEIESRDIQARKDLTPEQLAATEPYSSENISPEDAIILAAKDESLIVPEKDRYTFEEVQAEANKLFGGIPEGFVIVSDTTNPDYEFKAGYDIDNGNIIVNLAYIKKGESVRNLIAHELGHYAAGDPAIRAQLQAFLDGLPAEQKAKLERFVDRVYNKDTGEVRLEEKAVRAFVVMLKKGDNRNVFQKLLDTIKRWLNEKLGTKFQMTDMDAAAVLSGAVDRFRSGERIARQEEGIRKDTELSRMDNEYLDAVERGDSGSDNLIQLLRDAPQGERNAVVDAWVKRNPVATETAQRMVDEAAKAAGYKTGNFIGGIIPDTPRLPIFTTTNKSGAEWYATQRGDGGRVYNIAINAKNTFNINNEQSAKRLSEILTKAKIPNKFTPSSRTSGWSFESSEIQKYSPYDGTNPLDIAYVQSARNALIEAGYDSIGAMDILDDREIPAVVLISNPSQIKLTEPVTYDDAGNVIPLSQRFQKTSPDIRRAAAEPRREQVAGQKVGPDIATPPGIIKKNQEILRQKFFNPLNVTTENAEKVWGYIGELTGKNANLFAGEVNDTVQAETGSKERMATALFINDLLSYSFKLALQGDARMLRFMVNNRNKMPNDFLAGGASEAGRGLRAAGEQEIDGFVAYIADRDGKVERVAAELFGTKKPTKEEIAIALGALQESDNVQVSDIENLEGEIENVEKRTKTKITQKITDKIKGKAKSPKEVIDKAGAEYEGMTENQAKAAIKRKAEISVNQQADNAIDSLAKMQSDTLDWPEKRQNAVKRIIQQDLRQKPNMGRKAPWQSMLVGQLMQAGVSQDRAETLADLVWKQHEANTINRELKELEIAATQGPLGVIVQRIKDTPLSEQQDPEWKKNVIKDYLREAGLSVKAAETAARLYDSILNEKLAEAKQKAFEDTLKKQAPWNNYFSRNGRLAKNALETIKTAIRTGVLDPEQNTESIIAGQQGYKGFTKEQFQRMVQLEEIISNPSNDDLTRREAVDELNKIIAQVKIPVRIRDAIAAYYSAQALMGIPTATVNIASPVGFAIRNVITDVARYTFTGPQNIPVAFESFLNSMRNWYDHVSYAFRNQIYSNDVVEYLQGQNVLRELFDQGKRKWAKGQYASGMADMLVGMTQITGRVLSSLDQGAIAMIESQNIPRYALDAMANNNKIPKDKRKEVADLILNGRRKIKEDLVASGMKADRAGVLADLQVRSEMIAALSEFGISGQKVLDASINDALQTVGRNRVMTVDGVKQERNNLRDEGFLASLPIGFLERIAADAGAGSQAQQIFAKMLYGFALVPARVFSTAAWFSPYGFVRLGIDAISKKQGYKSRYAMSLTTDLQYKQRLTEAIAGSVVMLGLAAVTANSTDDDEEDDRPFKIVVTGNGPDYNTDRQYYDSWHKKWKPYSIHIVMGDTIIPINIGRGGEALFFPVLLAGALDDWKIKEKLNQARKDPKDLEMAAELLGSTFFALAQRGPYASFSQPLFDASKEGKIVPELFGQAGYFGKTFIPILGSSLARNVSDFFNAPVDRSSVQGAIWANTPVVGPWMGTQALNGLGQPMRADDFGDKLFKLGVPVVFSFPKNTPMNELNELILKKGGGPTIPTRTNAQRKFDEPLTDKEFEIYVREYGRVMSDMMFRNRRLLEASNPEQYNKTLDKYANGYGDVRGAKDFAVEAVRRLRRSQK